MTSPMPTTMTAEEESELKTVQQDEDTGRPVRITWTDSGLAYHNGWEQFRDVAEKGRVMDVETVGIYMGSNARVIMVAHSRDADNENWNVAMAIYKPCIVKREWLNG